MNSRAHLHVGRVSSPSKTRPKATKFLRPVLPTLTLGLLIAPAGADQCLRNSFYSTATVELQSLYRVIADYDSSGSVDLSDFFLFADNFGRDVAQLVRSERFDLTVDGVIDYDDFFAFTDYFGGDVSDESRNRVVYLDAASLSTPSFDSSKLSGTLKCIFEGLAAGRTGGFYYSARADSNSVVYVRVILSVQEGTDLNSLGATLADVPEPDEEGRYGATIELRQIPDLSLHESVLFIEDFFDASVPPPCVPDGFACPA